MNARHPLCLGLLLVAAWPAAADGLRDPMRPPLPEVRGSVAHEERPVLSAVLGTDAARSAIVNGQLVHAGSVLAGGYTIEAVLADGVRYRKGGVVQELHLVRPTPVKKPSALVAAAPSGAN